MAISKGTVWHPDKRIVREGVRLDQYASEDGWLIKPDLSAVSGLPMKYWIVSGNAALLMSQTEIDAVDAGEVAAALLADRSIAKSEFQTSKKWKAFALVLLDRLNAIHAKIGMSQITAAELKTDFDIKVDTLP